MIFCQYLHECVLYLKEILTYERKRDTFYVKIDRKAY